MDTEEKFDEIADALAESPECERRKMFGKKCVTVNGNSFIAFFKGDLAAKLDGEAHRKALALAGAELWDPSGKGKPMREWVQIPGKHIGRWKEFVEEARRFVSTLPPK